MPKNQTLNRSKFLNAVSDRAGAHRRDVEHIWENALQVLQESIKKGSDVSITGFGKFKQKFTAARPARVGKNPFTGETQKFAARPSKRTPRFLPAKQFKEFVSGSVKALPKPKTKPMALATAKAAPKKAAAAKKSTARKPAKKKTTARKSARKPARRR